MKYPFVLVYRSEKYSDVDKILITNSESLDCTIYFISNLDKIKYLFDSNYHLLVTFGNSDEYDFIFDNLPSRFKSKWYNFSVIPNINYFNNIINEMYILNCINREEFRPIFSIFTTTYNSYDKILRAYKSLKNQRLLDWEWVILDDSPNDEHFNFLKTKFINDKQVRLYKRATNSGNIGNVKNEAVALCRGSYVLELDHDDEILPDCLYDAAKVFDDDSSIGFVYMDFINIYENGSNFRYGDHICFGYGGYYCQKINDVWRFVYITPNINNITLSYLIACPNHPRIWRRSLLNKIGNYCEFLPICDDYEILLKTALNTKIAKIPKASYVQYMNENNNNFSLIRNREINRIGPKFISPLYYQYFNINERMKQLDAYEDEKYTKQNQPLWLRNSQFGELEEQTEEQRKQQTEEQTEKQREQIYEHKYCNLIINNDYKKQYCIIGIDSLIYNMEKIKELYNDINNDFIILESKCSVEYLQNKIDYYKFDRMKTYSFINLSEKELINYFMLMYKNVDQYEILNVNVMKMRYNSNLGNRHDVINHNTDSEAKYLEIGTEGGYTFKNVHFSDKIGVDPDPKYKDNRIIIKTSDEYFDELKINNNRDKNSDFDPDIESDSDIDSDDDIEYVKSLKNKKLCDCSRDVYFIDGMHLCDNVLRDFNNCVTFLNEHGTIFIDDIIPINYDEQLRIPNKHYYENNILKYGEPWTGDIWKVVYYILTHFEDKIDIKIYNNINYRGIAMIRLRENFKIDELCIDEIKKYDYFKEINNYFNILNKYLD